MLEKESLEYILKWELTGTGLLNSVWKQALIFYTATVCCYCVILFTIICNKTYEMISSNVRKRLK